MPAPLTFYVHPLLMSKMSCIVSEVAKVVAIREIGAGKELAAGYGTDLALSWRASSCSPPQSF
jgi:hypothetical protein